MKKVKVRLYKRLKHYRFICCTSLTKQSTLVLKVGMHVVQVAKCFIEAGLWWCSWLKQLRMYSTSHSKVLLIIRVGQYAAGINPFRQYLNAYQFFGGQEIIIY